MALFPGQRLELPPYAGGLDSLNAGTDWASVGLVLSIVGCFLLANAILFRHPRSLVAEHFGHARRELAPIRAHIFHRVNIHLGFLFLLGGFILQLYGNVRPQSAVELEFPTPWVGAILLMAVTLEVVGWVLSLKLFRRYVRGFLLEQPEVLSQDARLVREVGQLFDISSAPEDTVQSYRARIVQRLGLPRGDEVLGAAPSSVPSERRRAGRGPSPRVPAAAGVQLGPEDEEDLDAEFDDELV